MVRVSIRLRLISLVAAATGVVSQGSAFRAWFRAGGGAVLPGRRVRTTAQRPWVDLGCVSGQIAFHLAASHP